MMRTQKILQTPYYFYLNFIYTRFNQSGNISCGKEGMQ